MILQVVVYLVFDSSKYLAYLRVIRMVFFPGSLDHPRRQTGGDDEGGGGDEGDDDGFRHECRASAALWAGLILP